MADRELDETDNKGTRNGQSLLTNEAILAIRARYAGGAVLMRELAAEYGVSRSCIGLVIQGRRWGWLRG
jgi:hypothetical protein